MNKLIFLKQENSNEVIAFNKESFDFFIVQPIVEEIYEYILSNDADRAREKYNLSDEDLKAFMEMISTNISSIEAQSTANREIASTTTEVKRDLDRLVLNVSNVCNMKCAYCYACGGNYKSAEGVMSEETCIKIIDKFFDFFSDIRIIQFFGGEPLINLDVIEKTCQYIEHKFNSKEIKNMPEFGICTNGTLITDDVIDFVEKYKFGVTVSMDGDKYIHDLNRYYNNRKGTYLNIMDNIRKLYARTSQPSTIEVTYNRKHVENNVSIKNIIEHFKKELPTTYFHIVPVSTSETSLMLENREPFIKSVDDVFESFSTGTPISYSLVQRLIDSLKLKHKSDYICSAGLGTISVDKEGNIYPCFMFTDVENLCMGNIDDEEPFLNEKMKRVRDNFFALSKHTDEKCKDCMLEHFCSGCYGMNYFNNGKLSNYDKDFCEMNIHMAQKVIVNLTKCYQKIKVGE